MPELRPPANLDQLRRQAKEMVRSATNGDAVAVAQLQAVSDRLDLNSALLVVARDHGFTSWTGLKNEIDRRAVLDSLDVPQLRVLLGAHPEFATERMRNWCDHPQGASPLGYVAMMRFDTVTGTWRKAPGTGAMAQALLQAGAPVEGDPRDAETPLITAASYGDAEVVRVLISAGANIHATASSTAGGVPGGTALRHAAVFGMSAVIDILMAVGATDLLQSSAAGDITGMLTPRTPEPERVAALRIAAEHGQLHVIDQLLAANTPIDGVDQHGSTALHEAAYSGRADSTRHLLAAGADPTLRDDRFGGTPRDWCRHQQRHTGVGHGHAEVEQILDSVTPEWP